MTAFKNQTKIVLQGGVSTGDTFESCTDVLIIGRQYTSDPSLPPTNIGARFIKCTTVRIFDCDFNAFAKGLVLYETDGFTVYDNRFTDYRVDGMDLAQSWRGFVAKNVFKPGDTGDSHPDGIQMWSRPDTKPTSDIMIAENHVEGPRTQGITAFNHIRDGVDDGGFDRITIIDNTLHLGMPQAIDIDSGRNCLVKNNTVTTFDGSKFQARIHLNACTDSIRSGNTVGAWANYPADND